MSLEHYLLESEQHYNNELHLVGELSFNNGAHTALPAGTWVHSTRRSLDYVLALLTSAQNQHRQLAGTILREVLSLQDIDPVSPTYGIWPWYAEEPLEKMTPPDWNWADFCGARLAQILTEHAAQLPTDLLAQAREGLGRAAWSIFRRNIGPAYTNIAIMGGVVTLVAGEILHEIRLVEYGRRRLDAFLSYTLYHGGFTEYNSPTYTMVVLLECERALQMARDSTGRELAERIRFETWRMIADQFHPATMQWAGPHSRAYSDLLQADTLRQLAERAGGALPLAHTSSLSHDFSPVAPVPCPAEFLPRFTALPAPSYEIRQSFLRHPSGKYALQGTTWFNNDACLGSAYRECLWTQRHPLIAYWKMDNALPAVLRVRFLHNGKDFSSAGLSSVQDGQRVLSALILFTDRGDFHLMLDRPPHGLFEAEDFRLRYELTASEAVCRVLETGRFELSAGAYRALIDTLPGSFGSFDIQWLPGKEPGRVFLDGICYQGSSRAFDLAKIDPVLLVSGMQVLHVDQAPEEAPLTTTVCSAQEQQIRWPVGKGLTLSVPTRAEPYLPTQDTTSVL